MVVGGVAARAKPSLITQIVPSPMTLSYDATIQRLIREGALGQLLHVDVKGCGGAPLDAERPLHWRNQMEYSGLNIMTLGIFYASRPDLSPIIFPDGRFLFCAVPSSRSQLNRQAVWGRRACVGGWGMRQR